MISPDKAMLFQDAAIVITLVAPGLAAVYWLRRLFSHWRTWTRREDSTEAASLDRPALRTRHAPAIPCAAAPAAEQGDEIALSAERVRGLQVTAQEQLDAAQYALKRLVLDLQGVVPELDRPPPSAVVRLPEPQRSPAGHALAA